MDVSEYRYLFRKDISDGQIKKRVEYLEAFCREIIKTELKKNHVQSKNYHTDKHKDLQ